MIKEAIKQYQSSHNFDHFDPKCVLFDMDGVLYDSMRNHAAAWQEAMAQFDIHFTAADSYATEGARVSTPSATLCASSRVGKSPRLKRSVCTT